MSLPEDLDDYLNRALIGIYESISEDGKRTMERLIQQALEREAGTTHDTATGGGQ